MGLRQWTKLSHLKHRLSIIFLILICLFLYISFLGVASNNSVQIKTVSDFFLVTKLYFSWLGHIFDNIGTLTGNAVRMDWFPTNSTG